MGFAPGAVSGEKKKVKGGEKLIGYRWQGSPNVRYDSGVGIKVDCGFSLLHRLASCLPTTASHAVATGVPESKDGALYGSE